MREATERASRYRFRAEELRSISETWTDPQTRQVLSRVAKDYDWMAEFLEKNGCESPPLHME